MLFLDIVFTLLKYLFLFFRKENIELIKKNFYLKLTEACQTKANSKNNTGITGKTSTIGSKGAYASGNFAKIKAIEFKRVLQ
jgi:hypothetical protein